MSSTSSGSGRGKSKVAIIGGTGDLGSGLAGRLSREFDVCIGSRDVVRAEQAARELSQKAGTSIAGLSNDEATKVCDIAILAIPDLPSTDSLRAYEANLKGKLVISPIVSMSFKEGVFSLSTPDGSAAERVASVLGPRVVAALHTVPAVKLLKLEQELNYDVLVAADSPSDFAEAANIISKVKNLRPLHAGPLRTARMIEGITPVLLNLSKFSGLKSGSIKIV